MPGKIIRQQAKRQYEGFPDLHTCWEQSKYHKKNFLDHLDCKQREMYHRNVQGCKQFDDMIENIAGDSKYRLTFFNFYKIRGNVPPLKTYTNGLIKNKSVVESLANNVYIIKKKRGEIYQEIPKEYDNWPGHFTLEASKAFIFPEDRTEVQQSIANCILRRTMFRNACIKDCNSRIDTRSHDVFLLILQVLHSRNVYFHNL